MGARLRPRTGGVDGDRRQVLQRGGGTKPRSGGASSAGHSSNGQQDKAPKVLDLPVAFDATGTRHETDSMGGIDVPADRYWGAQTQRSLVHVSIGDDRMPHAVYHAYGYVKKAAAIINGQAGRCSHWKADLIVRVADEVIAGDLDESFPLYVWQTGSGTQSNMNVNEVISNRAIQLLGSELGSSKAPGPPQRPRQHGPVLQRHFSPQPCTSPPCRRSPVTSSHGPRELPAGHHNQAHAWHDVVKIGRTHLEDAVPLTVGQEWSGYATQLEQGLDRLQSTLGGLYELAMGGTAVGTGLNAPPGFAAASGSLPPGVTSSVRTRHWC